MKRNVKTAAAALSSTKKPVLTVRAGDGLENVVAGLGTDRDKRSYSQYNVPRIMTRFELENMYRASWLSKRIVNSVADDMTQKWRDFELDDADDNPQLEALQDAEKALQVKAKFNEAIRLARLYGGSLMILGTKDVINDLDLRKPLDPETVRQGDLKYIHVVDRWRCSPSGRLTNDLTSPNFGKPESYVLAESSVEVHHTRVLRFDGQRIPYFSWLQNGMWHDSELQHVVESVLNYDTTAAALASMMFEANIDVIQSENLTELLATRDGESKLIKRFQMGALMKSFNRTLVLDTTEKYEKKQNQFANLDKVWAQFMVDVSGAAEIPVMRLFGQSPGGLNATGDADLENYYGKIGASQESDLKPLIDQFDQVFVRSVLGQIPEGYDYSFNSLWQMDDKEKSGIEYQDAQRDQIYLNAGVVSEGLVASELKAKGTYRTMSSEDVQMAEELAEKMDEHEDITREQVQEAGAINNNNAKESGGKQPPDNKKKEKKANA